MKKIISVVLVLIMIFSLVACVDSTKETLKKASVGDKEDTSDKTSNPNHNANNDAAPQQSTLEENVLVDEQGVKITVKSLEYDNIFGPSVKVAIENNSGKNLTFSVNDASVNGYMNNAFFYVDVANGKKANDSITISEGDLELCDIETIADIAFSFHIIESDTYDTFLDTEIFKLETSAAENYEYTFDDSGELVYNENGIKIVIKGLAEDTILGQSLVVYMENNNNKDITVSTQDVSVNGYMLTAMLYASMTAGNHYVGNLQFFTSELEENDISEIENVELSFHAYDSDTYNTIFDTDPISINF